MSVCTLWTKSRAIISTCGTLCLSAISVGTHHQYQPCDLNQRVNLESLTIKKLDDVSEIHVVFQDDISVHFHEGQSNKEHKVFRGSVLSCPDGFPQGEDVVIDHLCQNDNSTIRSCSTTGRFVTHSGPSTSFKVEQEPPVAEVEVGVVSVLLHQLKQLRIQNLLGWKQTDSVAAACLHSFCCF